MEPMFEVLGSEIKGGHKTEECVSSRGLPIYINREENNSNNTSTDPPETTSSEEEENRKVRVKQ